MHLLPNRAELSRWMRRAIGRFRLRLRCSRRAAGRIRCLRIRAKHLKISNTCPNEARIDILCKAEEKIIYPG